MKASDIRLDIREVELDAAEWQRYARRLESLEGDPARLLREAIARVVEVVTPSGVGPVVVVLTRSDRALLREIDQEDLDAWFAATDGGRPSPNSSHRRHPAQDSQEAAT